MSPDFQGKFNFYVGFETFSTFLKENKETAAEEILGPLNRELNKLGLQASAKPLEINDGVPCFDFDVRLLPKDENSPSL